MGFYRLKWWKVQLSWLITFSLSPHVRKCLNTKLWDNTGCRHILFIHNCSFSFLFSTNSSPNLPWRTKKILCSISMWEQYMSVWELIERCDIKHALQIKAYMYKVLDLSTSGAVKAKFGTRKMSATFNTQVQKPNWKWTTYNCKGLWGSLAEYSLKGSTNFSWNPKTRQTNHFEDSKGNWCKKQCQN